MTVDERLEGQADLASVTCPDCRSQFSIGVVVLPLAGGGYRLKVLNPTGEETMGGLLEQVIERHRRELAQGNGGPQ